MARPKTKESEPMSFRLRKDLYDKLTLYSDETMIPKTRVIEKALDEYFCKNYKEEKCIDVK